jgi:hypothetical protein
MNNTLEQVRLLYAAFIVTWFLFIVVVKLFQPSFGQAGDVPSFFPLVLGVLAISEIGLAILLRKRLIDGAEAVLRANPEDQSAAARWRTGNLLSFCFAETVTIFGLLLKALGFDWKVAAIFFAAGLLLLLLWAPRAIRANA